MSYVVAVLVIAVFTVIYVVSYRLNSKIQIECDKRACEGCSMKGCINRFEREEK